MWRRRRKAEDGTTNDEDMSDVPHARDPSPTRRKRFPSGIKLLHDSSDSVVDIVFVHGLTGDRETTWKAKNAASPWPQTLLPVGIENTRVLTFGYDAYITDWRGMVSKNRVGNHSMNLLTAVATFRERDDTNDRPILFVCHSLGGLISEDALVQAKQMPEEHLQSILEATRGIIFLGTPHHGSGLAEWAEKLAKSINVLKQTNSDILAALKEDSEVLARIQQGFHTMVRSRTKDASDPIDITCFYEELPLPGVGVVVPSHSAILPGYVPIGIRANHMNMTKFKDAEDPGLVAILGEMRRWVRKIEKAREERLQWRREALLESLRFEEVDMRHMTIEDAHIETCDWLIKQPEYLDWLDITKPDEKSGFLWIKGKPGAGKSTLMKYALANAQSATTGLTIISFFFHARGTGLQKSTVGTYRSLLLQLLERLPELQRVFDSFNIPDTSVSAQYQWRIDSLKTLLHQAIRVPGRPSIACFIDALDECKEQQIRDMLSFFEQISRDVSMRHAKFRVCLSSRHYPHITVQIGSSIVLEDQDGHSEDISKYLHDKLRIGYSFTAQKIRQEVQDKASGVFMWVVLVVNILNKEYDCGRMYALRRRLEELPHDLHELFLDILHRDTNNTDCLLLCIQWVLFSSRPLSPEELYFAILSGIEPEAALLRWNRDEISVGDMKRFILNSSKGLVEITLLTPRERFHSRTNGRVQFIHESVRDFLLQGYGLNNIWPNLRENLSGQSYERLKDCCNVYMDVDIWDDVHFTLRERSILSASQTTISQWRSIVLDTMRRAYPFLEYACLNVVYHAERAEMAGIAENEFFDTFKLADWIELNRLFAKPLSLTETFTSQSSDEVHFNARRMHM